MKKLAFALLLLAPIAFGVAADPKPQGKIWTDPKKAAAEHPDFLLQGEYVGQKNGAKVGIQAADMDQGRFLVTTYRGGLPGAGWEGGELTSEVLERDALVAKVDGLERIERKSETLGLAAPENAAVVFSGEPNDTVQGKIEGGFLWAGSKTAKKTGSFTMHLEFRLPFKPATIPSSQDRGNSGVYIFNNYECQVIDSFALQLDETKNPFPTKSSSKQWCGSFYKFKLPDVPMVFPPLTWQTYDIDFTAPEFEGDKKVKNARITVKHNGVVIHDDVELSKGTGAGGGRPEKAEDFVYFQGHGNPVAFRNIWIVEK